VLIFIAKLALSLQKPQTCNKVLWLFLYLIGYECMNSQYPLLFIAKDLSHNFEKHFAFELKIP